MHKQYIDTVLASPMRALATYGSEGLNVVPVSVVTEEAGDIILYDFFMGKTVVNIKSSPKVALTAWDGLIGLQIKGEAVYEQTGNTYTEAVEVMKTRFPERTLRGIIRLTPQQVYSVSAGPEAGRQLV